MAMANRLAGCDRTPLPDSQVYLDGEVRRVFVGIDVDVGELLLARSLGADGVIAHHPIGSNARLGLAAVIERHEAQMRAEGIPADLKARLGSTVIEIGLADETAALRARAVLARFDGVPEIDGRTVRLSIHDGPRVLVDALRALDAEDVMPVSLAVREPSLDDAFLTLTGKRAESVSVPDRETVTARGPS